MIADVEERVARQFRSRFLRSYSRSKLRNDPAYNAVLQHLETVSTPLYDIGCGIGLLEFFLRENGWTAPITAIDHDQRKIASAQEVATHYRDLSFWSGDARDPVPHGFSVAALDVLHYFTETEQQAILDSIADAVAPGGVVLIRDAVRDSSMRYRMTAIQERFSRAIRWLKAERLHFPTREMVEGPFRSRGFAVEVTPLWGATPFNNYLFVFRRPTDGTTKV